MTSSWRELLTDERMLHREGSRNDREIWSASSQRGVVVAAHYLASAAGAEALEAGGTVVDAAIAASLALGVVEPAASGLGGMGMMLVHDAGTGRTVCLEGACRAPRRATVEELARPPRKNGYRAAALPVLPALLGHAWASRGTLSLDVLFAPAIRLASEGYPITSFQNHLAGVYERPLSRYTAQGFLGADGRPREAGSRFRQPSLARTLGRLARAGFEDFYVGQVGRAIVADMERGGGLLSGADFAEVPEIRELAPLVGSFGDLEVRTLPEPGGGATLLHLLHLFEALDAAELDPSSPEGALLFARLIRRARLDRRNHPGGRVALPDGAEVALWDRRSAIQAVRELDGDVASGETTHLCVVDGEGNAVSMTQSIERSFGSKVVSPELGFLLNGYNKTFKVKSPRHPFYFRPGARARSNAAPTVAVAPAGALRLTIGSTGSERMASGIFQVMVRLRNGQAPFDAVAAPRLHATPDDEVLLEAPRFSAESLALLERSGFTLTPYDAWAFEVGGLHLATFDGAEALGVAEPRRDGATAAL